MHVARLEISGFRGFSGDRSVDLNFAWREGSLAGWTVLAGRNASGKSTMLQALGLALAGPKSTGFIPSLADWISSDHSSANIRATLNMSQSDSYQPTLGSGSEPTAWMHFEKI